MQKLKMTFKKQQHPNIAQLGFVAMVTNTGLYCTLMKHSLWIEGETHGKSKTEQTKSHKETYTYTHKKRKRKNMYIYLKKKREQPNQ